MRNARHCCPFHEANGSPDLVCGDDTPDRNNEHLRTCAYLAGADCTCGAYADDYASPDVEAVDGDEAAYAIGEWLGYSLDGVEF